MEKKIGAIIMMIAPQVISLIAEKQNIGEPEAAEKFYWSKVYTFLEKEETKLWHYSPLTLYDMYTEENKTGNIVFPEEV
jgi:hypothetical protein